MFQRCLIFQAVQCHDMECSRLDLLDTSMPHAWFLHAQTCVYMHVRTCMYSLMHPVQAWWHHSSCHWKRLWLALAHVKQIIRIISYFSSDNIDAFFLHVEVVAWQQLLVIMLMWLCMVHDIHELWNARHLDVETQNRKLASKMAVKWGNKCENSAARCGNFERETCSFCGFCSCIFAVYLEHMGKNVTAMCC